MTHLQVYRPFDLWGFSDDVNRCLCDLGVCNETGTKDMRWTPAVNISENSEALTIHAALAGLKRDDLTINVEDGVLTIQGERKYEEKKSKGDSSRVEFGYGAFTRSFSLPTTVDTNKIDAHMKDGILEIVIPKREEAKPKQIAIQIH